MITKDSVLTAGIEITTRWQPPDGSPFGTVTQSLTLGRSFVSLTASGSGATAPGVAPTTGAGVDSAAVPDAGAPPTTDGAALPGTVSGVLPGTTPIGALPGSVPTVQVDPAGLTTPDGFDLNLFPPFVVAALGVLLLGQLLRYRGVRQS